MIRSGTLRDELTSGIAAGETFDTLIEHNNLRIERIVSTGQATPEGEWCDQSQDEFVLLIAGAARLRIEGEADDRALEAGDWLHLPARCRHRVTWTQSLPATVWLAIHLAAEG
jgi:cupin 2 domain-containing protein